MRHCFSQTFHHEPRIQVHHAVSARCRQASPAANEITRSRSELTYKSSIGWLGILCIALWSHSTQAKPLNIVILLPDDLGWKDISCYDGPVHTPTINRLALGGMRFTDLYSGAAVCSPLRAVLLTGRTNVRASISSWIHDDDHRPHLPMAEVTIAEIFDLLAYLQTSGASR